jgi:hypothetical protein
MNCNVDTAGARQSGVSLLPALKRRDFDVDEDARLLLQSFFLAAPFGGGGRLLCGGVVQPCAL